MLPNGTLIQTFDVYTISDLLALSFQILHYEFLSFMFVVFERIDGFSGTIFGNLSLENL